MKTAMRTLTAALLLGAAAPAGAASWMDDYYPELTAKASDLQQQLAGLVQESAVGICQITVAVRFYPEKVEWVDLAEWPAQRHELDGATHYLVEMTYRVPDGSGGKRVETFDCLQKMS